MSGPGAFCRDRSLRTSLVGTQLDVCCRLRCRNVVGDQSPRV